MKIKYLLISFLLPILIGGFVFAQSFIYPEDGGTGTVMKPQSGQLLIGTAGNIYTPAYLTEGSNIAVTFSSGAITISSTYTETDPIWQASSTLYIPYTGATASLDLGIYDLTATNLYGDGSNLTGVGAAAASALTISAKAAENLTKGDVVYISGATGQFPQVMKADNTDDSKHFFLGVAAETKVTGQTILIRVRGELTGLNMSAYSDGDSLYLATNGTATNTVPTSGATEHIGYVSYNHATQGKLVVMHHAPHSISAPSSAEIYIRMGGNTATSTVSFKNYLNTQVAAIDALGDLTVRNVATGTWQGTPVAYQYGGTGTSTALALQNLWWGDGTGKLVQVASSTLAGAGVLSGGQTNYLPLWTSATTQGTSTIFQLNSNVGIGTTAPISLLNLASTNPKLYLTDTDAIANSKHFFINYADGLFSMGTTSDSLLTDTTFLTLSGSTTTNSIISFYNANNHLMTMGVDVNDNNTFKISTSTDFSAGNFLNITSAGRVGIGTTTPAYLLDVYGNARLGTSTASNIYLRGTINTGLTNGFLKVDANGLISTSTIDIGDNTNLTAGRSLTLTGDDVAADAELYTKISTFSIRNATTTGNPVAQHKFPTAITITRISCSGSQSTTTIQFDERAEATPNTGGTDVLSAALGCGSSTTSASTAFANATIAANAILNLDIDAMTGGSTTTVNIHVEYTIDD